MHWQVYAYFAGIVFRTMTHSDDETKAVDAHKLSTLIKYGIKDRLSQLYFYICKAKQSNRNMLYYFVYSSNFLFISGYFEEMGYIVTID